MIELIDNYFIVPLFLALLFQLLFYFGLFSRLAFYKKKEHQNVIKQPVSVVICAKNEETNLRKNLPFILDQNYPAFEVVVVDDQSEDNTLDYLEEIASNDKKLKIVHLNKDVRDHIGKKLALSLGIRKASNEILLLSDADCQPSSNNWIQEMVNHFQKDKEIVLGYSPYKKVKSFLNHIIQYETFYSALQYFSLSLAGMTYMGVGRNLSYKREMFLKTGFSSHLHVPYGDDDLFVNETASNSNVSIEINKDSHVISEAPSSLLKWFRQKKRHIKGSREYKPEHRKWLGYLWLSNIVFYALFAFALIFNPISIWVWSIFFVRTLSMMIVFVPALKKLNNINLAWFAMFYDVFIQIIYLPLMSLMALLSKKENGW